MHTPKLLEADIKARLIKYLHERKHLSDDSLVISELTIGGFSRRVDLVVATPNGLTAYEIKSASDNLSRLTGQVQDYLKHFDKVIVVADTKHIQSALQSTTTNVGVLEVSGDKFIVRRRGVKSKVSNKSSLISFLTATEISKLAPSNIKSSNRTCQRNEVIKTASIKRLRTEIYKYLHRKFSLTSNNLLDKLNSGAEISTQDVEELSIYIADRRLQNQKKAQKSQLWSAWEAELSLSA
ncbi:sce7726 family protein [Vibrio parahaemolyticus]|nr:sce7726 family protein [Vibrio parahaemolyticus]